MRSRSWFFFFLGRSIRERCGRFVLSAAAVFLAVSIVSALATLTAGVERKVGAELTSYGANMIVTGASGGTINRAVAQRVKTFSGAVREASPRVFGTAAVGDRWVEVIGMEHADMTGYRITGREPVTDVEVMVGTDLARILGVTAGNELAFSGGRSFVVRGTFERGSDEDEAVIMPLQAAADLLGVQGVSALLLNADTHSLSALEKGIRDAFPFLSVKTVRQVAVAEEGLLSRIQLLMLIVTVVVFLSSVVALGSTMGANVIERTGELGVLKALGATRRDVAAFFFSEAALFGLLGGIGGWICGVAIAEIVSRTAFGSFIPIAPFGLLVALAVGLSLAVIATLLPVRSASRMVPANILKGE